MKKMTKKKGWKKNKTIKAIYGGQINERQTDERQTDERQTDDGGQTLMSKLLRLANIGKNYLTTSTSYIMKNLETKTGLLRNTLETPEGKKLLTDLGVVSGELAIGLKPGIDKVTDIVGEEEDKMVKIGENTALNAVGLIPVIGEAFEAVRVLGNVTDAGLTAADATAKLTTVGAETALKVKPEIDRVKNIVGKMEQVYENASDAVNKVGTTVSKTVDKTIDTLEKNVPTNNDDAKLTGGKKSLATLKRLQKCGIRCKNRTLKSQHTFLKK